MAKLPNAENAIIDERKISDYLLNESHNEGGPKARFVVRFGFSTDAPDVLIAALRTHAASTDVARSEAVSYGVIHELSGPLATPDGRNPTVKTVWIVREGESQPRFVTLVPD